MENKNLIEPLRADLINIILEDIFYHSSKLSPQHFPPLVEQILNLFPSEIKVSILFYLYILIFIVFLNF